MPRKSNITVEVVAAAMDALLERGENPTTSAVRAEIGEGSFSTVSSLMKEVTAAREEHSVRVAEMPESVMVAVQKAAADIYRAAHKEAMVEVESVRVAASKRVSQAESQAAEAVKEVARLEGDLETHTQKVDALQEALDAERKKLAAADATASGLREALTKAESQAERLDKERTAAEARATKAAEEAAELRGELNALQKGVKK